VQAVRSFVVGANARCGSTLLCRALADTGVAGRPEEYFITGPAEAFPPDWKFWEEGPLALEHGVSDRRAYLDLVFRLGTTGNGVFGAKMMWNYSCRDCGWSSWCGGTGFGRRSRGCGWTGRGRRGSLYVPTTRASNARRVRASVLAKMDLR
jgi:Stf0 sulphotransferase